MNQCARILKDSHTKIQVSLQTEEPQTNPLCPHRSKCLDNICMQYLPVLNCTDCRHFTEQENREMLFYDLEGCVKLIWILFGAKNPSQLKDQNIKINLFERREWEMAQPTSNR